MHAVADSANREVGAAVSRTGSLCPLAIVDQEATDWSLIWQVGGPSPIPLLRALRLEVLGQRAFCALQLEREWTPEVIRSCLRTFRGSGLGIDALPFKLVSQLDDEGLIALRSLLIGILRDLSFPLQGLFVLVHLIGKKGGASGPSPCCTSSTACCSGSGSAASSRTGTAPSPMKSMHMIALELVPAQAGPHSSDRD